MFMSDGRAFTDYTPSYERAQYYKQKFNSGSSSELRQQMQHNGTVITSTPMCTKNSSQGQTLICGNTSTRNQHHVVDFPSGPLSGPYAAAASNITQ